MHGIHDLAADPQSQAEPADIEAAKGDLVFIPHGTVHGHSEKGRKFTMLIVSFFPGGPPLPAPAPAPTR